MVVRVVSDLAFHIKHPFDGISVTVHLIAEQEESSGCIIGVQAVEQPVCVGTRSVIEGESDLCSGSNLAGIRVITSVTAEVAGFLIVQLL